MLSGFFSLTGFYISSGSGKTHLKEIWALFKKSHEPLQIYAWRDVKESQDLAKKSEIKFSWMGQLRYNSTSSSAIIFTHSRQRKTGLLLVEERSGGHFISLALFCDLLEKSIKIMCKRTFCKQGNGSGEERVAWPDKSYPYPGSSSLSSTVLP